ncbi:MAG: hypothetical protein AAGA54_14240 [Myxococcota bacterium]
MLWMRWAGASLMLVGCTPAVTSGEAEKAGTAADSTGMPSQGSTATTEQGGTTNEGDTTAVPTTTPEGDDTTTTATSTSTGDEGTTSTTGTTSVPQGTGGLGDDCDPYTQDCATGLKCNPYANDGNSAWNDAACFPVADEPLPFGAPCIPEGAATGLDDCDVGSLCWGFGSAANTGHCIPLCVGSAEAPECGDPNAACVALNGGAVPLCLQTCDVDLQDCPSEFESCITWGSVEVCYPDF